MTYSFTSEKRDIRFGGWARNVKVGEQEYALAVKPTKRVRIAFKPRGENRGWQWEGSVYRIGSNWGRVWVGRVGGSIGCKGLLKAAGVLTEEAT